MKKCLVPSYDFVYISQVLSWRHDRSVNAFNYRLLGLVAFLTPQNKDVRDCYLISLGR